MNHPENDWEQQREQLSALLDNELSARERAALETHLEGCDQCRVELESLQRTRTLLCALPQPALPRSFTLPLEPAAAAPERHAPAVRPAAAPAAAQRLTSLPGNRTPVHRRPVQALQWLSTIAAVLGIVVLLSGVFSTLSVSRNTAAGSALTSNQGDQNGGAIGQKSPTQAPNANTPSETAAGADTPAPTPPATVPSPSSTSGATPGAGFSQHTSDGSSSSPLGQIFSATTIGLSLLLLSICGFVTSWALRRRW